LKFFGDFIHDFTIFFSIGLVLASIFWCNFTTNHQKKNWLRAAVQLRHDDVTRWMCEYECEKFFLVKFGPLGTFIHETRIMMPCSTGSNGGFKIPPTS